MSSRAIRRAAERNAQKQAQKTLSLAAHKAPSLPEVPAPALPQSPTHSERPTARVLANRLNARLSTGPSTPAGKSISSLNAVKAGLTGRTVLLPSDDAVAYQRHIEEYEAEFKPVGLRERELVQSLADTQWRLQRIPGLEMAVYSLGSIEFADSYQEQPAELRSSMIELAIFVKYEKQLRNLQLQESRLHRRHEKESAELRQLQKARKDQADTVAEPAASFTETAPQTGVATGAQPVVGFEFSTTEIGSYVVKAETAASTQPALKNAA